jgi:hypothetical protein
MKFPLNTRGKRKALEAETFLLEKENKWKLQKLGAGRPPMLTAPRLWGLTRDSFGLDCTK